MKAPHWSGDIPANVDEARDRIVDAAVDLAEARGLHRINIKLIAQLAGVSRTTVYAYFPDKEAILTHAFTQAAERAARQVESDIVDLDTAHAMLLEATIVGIRFVKQDRLLSLALRNDFISSFVPGAALNELALANVVAGLSPLFNAFPEYRSEQFVIAEYISRVILSLVTIPSLMADTDRKLRQFVSAWLAGIIPPEASAAAPASRGG